MPFCCSSLPRKKFPPPTTTATWIPSRTPTAICRAIARTTSGSTPTRPPPKTSPESLRSTRRPVRRGSDVGGASVRAWVVTGPPRRSARRSPDPVTPLLRRPNGEGCKPGRYRARSQAGVPQHELRLRVPPALRVRRRGDRLGRRHVLGSHPWKVDVNPLGERCLLARVVRSLLGVGHATTSCCQYARVLDIATHTHGCRPLTTSGRHPDVEDSKRGVSFRRGSGRSRWPSPRTPREPWRPSSSAPWRTAARAGRSP